tara:strand:- start:921 stop:1253 length:333 start_codon:yes stop_codon:yes gene_type:complete
MNGTKQQVFALAKKHNCTIDVFMCARGEYDIVVDAPEGYGFSGGDLSAICINNSFMENCNTAKAFWKHAYSELKSELKYLESKLSEEEQRKNEEAIQALGAWLTDMFGNR